MRIGYTDVNQAYVPEGPSGSGDFADPVTWHMRQVHRDGDEHHVDPKVRVNVFDGGSRNVVEMSIDGAPFSPMTHLEPTNDDYIVALHERYRGTPDSPGTPEASSHIWQADIPENLSPGTHVVTVRSTSAWGQVGERTSEFTIRTGKP